MRFVVFVKATAESEAGALPTPEMLEKMGRFNAELAKAGALLAAEGLQPSAKGARIAFGGEKPAVTDGPFAETKELVAGFWMLQAHSKDEIVAWLLRAPFERNEQVEIRQVHEMMPPPVVDAFQLNRAVAIGMAYGPQAGLELLMGDAIVIPRRS
jgi:hypothetical protein